MTATFTGNANCVRSHLLLLTRVNKENAKPSDAAEKQNPVEEAPEWLISIVAGIAVALAWIAIWTFSLRMYGIAVFRRQAEDRVSV